MFVVHFFFFFFLTAMGQARIYSFCFIKKSDDRYFNPAANGSLLIVIDR